MTMPVGQRTGWLQVQKMDLSALPECLQVSWVEVYSFGRVVR